MEKGASQRPSKVAITLRESLSANDTNWSAMLYDGKDYCFSKKYKMHIVDRVGGGDSFGGGLISAILCGYDSSQTIEFAVAASCLKHSVEGDFNMVSMDEVQKLAGGDASGRVQRRFKPFLIKIYFINPGQELAILPDRFRLCWLLLCMNQPFFNSKDFCQHIILPFRQSCRRQYTESGWWQTGTDSYRFRAEI